MFNLFIAAMLDLLFALTIDFSGGFGPHLYCIIVGEFQIRHVFCRVILHSFILGIKIFSKLLASD